MKYTVVRIESNERYGVNPIETELASFNDKWRAYTKVENESSRFITEMIGDRKEAWSTSSEPGEFHAHNHLNGHDVILKSKEV